jgi:hypothetical protein
VSPLEVLWKIRIYHSKFYGKGDCGVGVVGDLVSVPPIGGSVVEKPRTAWVI